MHFLLINVASRRVEDEFDAADLPTARQVALARVQKDVTAYTLAIAVRIMRPQVATSLPTIDDQLIP